MHRESGCGGGVGSDKVTSGVRQSDQYSHRWNFWQKCSFPFLSVSVGCMMFLFLGFPLRTTMLRRWGPRQCKATCVLRQLLFQQLCRTKSQRRCPEKQLLRNNSDARQSIQLWEPSSTSLLLVSPWLFMHFSLTTQMQDNPSSFEIPAPPPSWSLLGSAISFPVPPVSSLASWF